MCFHKLIGGFGIYGEGSICEKCGRYFPRPEVFTVLLYTALGRFVSYPDSVQKINAESARERREAAQEL